MCIKFIEMHKKSLIFLAMDYSIGYPIKAGLKRKRLNEDCIIDKS